MSKITLNELSHSYLQKQSKDEDWAIRNVNIDWEDGGAYALLGPSGCGKTTLLNIISGLIIPTRGQILFNDEDITEKNPVERNIAQIFQFPVIYDTMTVFENLAFPLRNRKIPDEEIKRKVNEIAEMLELTSTLHNRASGLTADGKQKISLGRGLVRSDVNVIMFDEPLTVIDPHLKWVLRSKLKELHQKIKRTMIYVTHDQTEALTFADQVVVMHEGQIVQTGTPVELFEKPKHTFVGHFIGSPGMNILPCEIDKGLVVVNGTKIKTSNLKIDNANFSKMEIGVRPEFISFNNEGLPVKILNVSNIGKNKIIETESDSGKIKLITKASEKIPEGSAFLTFKKEYTYVYGDNWIVD
ncbi:ABC transporter ATP-binding protein [Candidatus Pelagibacter communis]|uniref:ABC transporter ATP-binding protein n=1 Tax=Pelagibacter ubique TaxID=198252 RepID=UPI00094C9948|nr:ABC transporter ATP-binding protein [Candidatus Pelagibacter ubique]